MLRHHCTWLDSHTEGSPSTRCIQTHNAVVLHGLRGVRVARSLGHRPSGALGLRLSRFLPAHQASLPISLERRLLPCSERRLFGSVQSEVWTNCPCDDSHAGLLARSYLPARVRAVSPRDSAEKAPGIYVPRSPAVQTHESARGVE